MTEQEFWELIDSARETSGRSHDPINRITIQRLVELDATEIISFAVLMHQFSARAYAWELWSAAYILGGGCSDDSFMDFRSWLISMGPAVYEAAVADPESLADLSVLECIFDEEFGYVADQAYRQKVGRELYADLIADSPDQFGLREPTGTRCTSDADRARRFPKLWKIQGKGG